MNRKEDILSRKDEILKKYWYKKYMEEYRNRLKMFVKSPLNDDDFLPLDFKDNLMNAIYHEMVFYKATIDFNRLDWYKDRLRPLISNLWDNTFFLSEELSEYCGCYKLSSLNDLNWTFPFYPNGGWLGLISYDVTMHIVLSWYEEDDLQKLDIEIARM